MAKIYAPNKEYSGMTASVAFTKGTGETENPVLLDWFQEHGYRVEEPESSDPIISDLIKRAEKLKLKLPDGLTADQVRAAIEQAEAEKAEKEAGKAEPPVPVSGQEAGK